MTMKKGSGSCRGVVVDTDFCNKRVGVKGKKIGMYRKLKRVKKEFPRIQYGYFNRTKENFYPEGFKKGWLIRQARSNQSVGRMPDW
jgi:hypothetical protein